jgi:hypothetical protein
MAAGGACCFMIFSLRRCDLHFEELVSNQDYFFFHDSPRKHNFQHFLKGLLLPLFFQPKKHDSRIFPSFVAAYAAFLQSAKRDEQYHLLKKKS